MVYKITCGNSLAEINTMGGELVSFIKDDVEYIWNGNSEYWSGHAPVLFPTVGALKNRETEINGKIYQMKKHGFARKSEFQMIEITKDSASFSLKSSAETKISYPFDFELIVKYTIFNNGFNTEYKVINTDHVEMLFGIGGHIGFNCPLYAGAQFTDYTIEFEDVENGPFYYTRTDDSDGVIHREDRAMNLEGKKDIQLDYSLFDKDVLVIDNIKSKTLKLFNKKDNKGIQFIMNGFSSIGLWTPPLKKASFICIEPWTLNPDFSTNSQKFSEKPNVSSLSPNKEFTVSYEVKVI